LPRGQSHRALAVVADLLPEAQNQARAIRVRPKGRHLHAGTREFDSGLLERQLPGRAIHRPGQANVAQDDVGRLSLDQAVGGEAVPGRPHDGEIGLGAQQRSQPLVDGRVILDDREPDQDSVSASGRRAPRPPRSPRLPGAPLPSGSRTVTVVPSPTADSASIVPPCAVTISRAR